MFPLFRRRIGDFDARQRESSTEQPRDDIVSCRDGDAIGGLGRVGALQPALMITTAMPVPSHAAMGIAVAEQVFPVL